MFTGGGRKRLIWPTAGIGAATAGFLFFLRSRHLKWGATRLETQEFLPGDELLPEAESTATHAITIDAPPKRVWPWLAQIGQDKGDFYSYTMLENLVGCDMHNAHELHPEWQSLKQGDEIYFHPSFPPQPVSLLEEYRHLVIGANLGTPGASTWAFVLRPFGKGKTRLIIRLRWRSHHGLGHIGDVFLLEPAHFVMERKMMLTIKQLAEGKPYGSY